MADRVVALVLGSEAEKEGFMPEAKPNDMWACKQGSM